MRTIPEKSHHLFGGKAKEPSGSRRAMESSSTCVGGGEVGRDCPVCVRSPSLQPTLFWERAVRQRSAKERPRLKQLQETSDTFQGTSRGWRIAKPARSPSRSSQHMGRPTSAFASTDSATGTTHSGSCSPPGSRSLTCLQGYKQRVAEYRDYGEVFGSACGHLAHQDPLEREHSQVQAGNPDGFDPTIFLPELSETVHSEDDIKWLAPGACQHRRIKTHRWHVGRAHRTERHHESRVREVFEPKVYVLGNNGCSLHRGCGESDDHEADPGFDERSQKGDLSF